MKKLLSDCCQSPVHVSGGTVDLTHFYVCDKCLQACDAHEEKEAADVSMFKDCLMKLKDIIDARVKAITALNSTKNIPLNKLRESGAYKQFINTTKEYGKLQEAFNSSPIWTELSKNPSEAEKIDQYFGDPIS